MRLTFSAARRAMCDNINIANNPRRQHGVHKLLVHAFIVFQLLCLVTANSISHCKNQPTHQVKTVLKVSDDQTFVVSDTNLYALVEYVTGDHLPIIAPDFPKSVDSQFRKLIEQHAYTNASLEALPYLFEGTKYYIRVSSRFK